MNYLTISIILGILLITTQLVTIILFLNDYRKRRKIKKFPFISFIIPCYNDEQTIEKTIESIYESCKKSNMELFTINDSSSDNSLEILKKLKKKYGFNLINNIENKGKSLSINNAAVQAKGEIIFIIDSDIILNKPALEDVIARFNNNSKLGAVSCEYKCDNKRFLLKMQNIEYSTLTILHAAGNNYSSTGLCGGCMAIKKDSFMKVGMLTQNAISEDLDMALKLNKIKLKVEQSLFLVNTESPIKLKKWYKQKLRWGSGIVQCFLRYYSVYLTNPIYLFIILSSLLSIILAFFLVYNNIIVLREFLANTLLLTIPGLKEFFSVIEEYTMFWGTVIGFLIYPLLFLPYVLFNIKSKSQKYSDLILVYPYVLIYMPLLTIVYLISIFRGIYKFFTLKEKDIGWRLE